MGSLKPCAHCGSTDIDDEDCSTMETNGTRIVCNGCGVMVEGYSGSTCTARATAKWNTRASDATAERLVGLLRAVWDEWNKDANGSPTYGTMDKIKAALAAFDAERNAK